MSYILDALRKSESERQREAGSGLARAPVATARHRIPVWTLSLIVLLSIALIGLAAAWWRSDRRSMQGPASMQTTTTEALSDVAPREPSAAVAAEPRPVDTTPQPIRRIRELDPGLPAYRLEFVAYNSEDANRSSAWINGSRYLVGERIGDGPELVEIRSDSVLLEFRNQRFLLTTR